MDRRTLIAGTIALLAAPLAAEAQPAGKVPIGFLSANARAAMSARTEAFRQGLRELGYVEEENISVEYLFAEGRVDRLRALVTELVRLKVSVIVTEGTTATRFAKEATSTIPIVMAQDPDPVGTGFVASLARPGGNITGLSNLRPDLGGKRLEVLKETLPRHPPDTARDGTRRECGRGAASIPGGSGPQGHRDGVQCREQGAC